MYRNIRYRILPVILSAVFITVTFSGCGTEISEKKASEPVSEIHTESPGRTAAGIDKESTVYDGFNRPVQIDDKYYYTFAAENSKEIRKYDRMTDKETVLYTEEDAYKIREMELYDGELYFREAYDDDNPVVSSAEYGRILKISISGGEAELLKDDVPADDTWTMSIYNNILYLDNRVFYNAGYEDEESMAYDISKGKMTDETKVTGYEDTVPEEATCIMTDAYPGKYTFAYCENKFGCLYYAKTDSETYKTSFYRKDLKTKEEKVLNIPESASIVFITPEAIISTEYRYDDDNYSDCWYDVYRTDIKTNRTEKIAEKIKYTFIDADDEYMYVSDISSEEYEKTIRKIPVTDLSAQGETIVSMKAEPGRRLLNGASILAENFCVTPLGIFYENTEKGRIYEYLIKKDKPIIVGTAYYDSHIEDYGHVEAASDKVTLPSDKSKIVYTTYVEYLVLDGDDAASKKINETLKDNALKDAEDTSKYWRDIDDDEYVDIPGSYTLELTGIPYADDNYVSVMMDWYQYEGGAHGMGGETYYLFDRKLGKELKLSDVVANSEEEVQNIIAARFKELIDKNPENYWDNAVDTVKSTS